MKLLEDLKLTGRMLGCHQVTAEVLGPEVGCHALFSSILSFFWGKTRGGWGKDVQNEVFFASEFQVRDDFLLRIPE